MLLVRGKDQQTATAISQLANRLLLHLPLPSMTYLPSFAEGERTDRIRAAR